MAETKRTKRTKTVQPRADLTEAEKLRIPQLDPNYHFTEVSTEVALDIAENRKVLLTGHAGTGKSSMFMQIASHLNQPVSRVNLNGQTTISDFVGCWTVKGGETIWVDGVLPNAMKRGMWLILDEIDFAEPQILSIVNAVAEKDGALFLKEKGDEVITPHKNFRLLATANTVGIMEDCRHLYQGTNIMNRALLDRFRVYHVEYLTPAKETKVLMNSIPDMTEKVASTLVEFANDIRKAYNDENISCTFSLRQLVDFAELIARKSEKNPKLTPQEIVFESAKVGLYSKMSREDGEVIKQILQRTIKPPSR